MNLLTTHHRTRGNGPRTRHAADAGRGMGERVAADAVRTGARAVAVGVDVAGAAGRVFLADHETPLTPPVDSRDILTGLRLAPRTHGAH